MQKPIEERFEEYVEKYKLISPEDAIVVGVSGGADSVCLLYLLNEYRKKVPFSITTVHVNHMLRGDEAAADAAFVQTASKEMDIRCLVARCDVKKLAEVSGMSIEEAGRSARYKAFEKVALGIPGSKIAVAHNFDDNIETILLNMIRGTDLKGFTGMHSWTVRHDILIIRPMLGFTKEEIKEFLEMKKIQYREDSSNLETEYTRNKIRLQVMPVLKEINPRTAAHIDQLARAVGKVEYYTDWIADDVYQRAVTMKNGKAVISLAKLEEADRFIKNKVIYKTIVAMAGSAKDIQRVHVEEAVDLIAKQTGRRISLPYSLVAKKDYYDLVIEKSDEDLGGDEPEIITINRTDISWKEQSIESASGTIITYRLVFVTDENRQQLIQKNQYTKTFDYDKIVGDIMLGVRSSGDKIILKEGTKPVKKFFIDEKIPQDRRDKILILKDEESVLWIVGFRISEHYKITDTTKMALQVRISGGKNEWEN